MASDVVVVGAGIVGCGVAYELARRGASVQLVDDRPIGLGATQASAGILAPYIEAREGSALLPLAVRSLELYDEFVSAVCSDSGASVTYCRSGTLDVAFDDDELQTLRETARYLAEHNVRASLVDAAAVRGEEAHVADGAAGALIVDAHGFVAALQLTRALADAAARRRTTILEPARVRRIRADGDRAVVETDHASFSAAAVVLAAGSWSSDIAVDGVEWRPPVRPVRGQLISLGWRGSPLRRVTWSRRCYLVPWPDGTLLVGATMEEAGFDERTTAAGVRDLLGAACDVVPQAWGAGFNGARAGLRPATPDGLPILGRSSVMPQLIYATGHFRNGVLLAPLTARLVADMVDMVPGDRIDPMLAPLRPERFGDL